MTITILFQPLKEKLTTKIFTLLLILLFAGAQIPCVAEPMTEEGQYIEGLTVYACDIGPDELNRLAREGVIIASNSSNNYLNLEQGNIMLNPKKDLIVGTRESNIYIGSGSSVFIMESGNSLVLYDLLQTRPKQVLVTLTVNKQLIVMEPGRMLVLTRQNLEDFEKLEDNCHSVAYRNVQRVLLDARNDQLKAFLADFSIASALITIRPLQRLTVSNNRQDRLALEKLLKGALIMGDFATTAQPTAEGSDNSITAVRATDPAHISIASNTPNQLVNK